MAKYLVTGGAGFIGSHLVDKLVAVGHSVRVLDDLSTGRIDNLPPGVEFVKGDVFDPGVVHGAFDGIHGCFHLAAIASVERSRRDWLRAHKVNLTGTVTVLEEARRANQVPVVFASSAAIYGDVGEVPAVENMFARPVSTYGVDKLGSEMYAAVASRGYNVPTVGLRFFNVYGPRQNPHSPYSGVISIFLQRLSKRTTFELHGDGGQVRDFVFVDDAVRALCLAMDSASTDPKIFNVCTGAGTTIRHLGMMIAALCDTPFTPQHKPPRQGDLRTSIGDPRKARVLLGFETQTPLPDGLAQTLMQLIPAKVDEDLAKGS
jgi:UDP-glucose 4-epimerase